MQDRRHTEDLSLGRDPWTEDERELFVDALNLLEPYHGTSRFGAGRRIIQIVRDFRQYRKWQAASPRRVELYRQCRDVEDWADKGMRLFRDFHLDFLDFLQRGEDDTGWITGENLFDEANLGTALLDTDEDPQGWAARLQKLRELARRRRSELDRDEVIDQGGGATTFKNMYGSAKHILVKDCGLLFAQCRPSAIRSYDQGAFHSFASMVYGMAASVGGDEEGAGLSRYIRFSVPRVRELEASNLRLVEIDELIANAHLLLPDERRELYDRRHAEETRWREIHAILRRGPKDRPRKSRRAPKA